MTLEEIIHSLKIEKSKGNDPRSKTYFQHHLEQDLKYPVFRLEESAAPQILAKHSGGGGDYVVDNNAITELNTASSIEVILCNPTTTYDINIYLLVDGTRVYHMILHPGLEKHYDLYGSDNITFDEFFKKNDKEIKHIYGKNSKCEKDIYMLNSGTGVLNVVHLREIDELTQFNELGMYDRGWGIPVSKITLARGDNEFENFLDYSVMDPDMYYWNDKNKKIKDAYPKPIFDNLFNLLTKFPDKYNDITPRFKLVNAHCFFYNNHEYLLIIISDGGKPVIWVYKFRINNYIKGLLFHIRKRVNYRYSKNRSFTEEEVKELQFKKEEVEELRYNNNLRTLYDLDSYDELMKIRRETIIALHQGEFKKKNKDGVVEKITFYKKKDKDEFFAKEGFGSFDENKYVHVDLFANQLVPSRMKTFHIQVLQQNDYQNPLYHEKSTITTNMRLTSLNHILHNLKFSSEYYKELKKTGVFIAFPIIGKY